MRDLIALLDIVLAFLRSASMGLIAIAAVLAAIAWAVRARKANPFGALARFSRGALEPLLAPFDRRLARFGKVGSEVPWWALLIVVIACGGAIMVLGFVRDQLVSTYLAVNAGPRGMFVFVVRTVVGVLQLALIVHVVLSWVGGSYSALGRLTARMTDWFLAPLRRGIPAAGGIDFAPLIAYVLLLFIQAALLQLV